MADQPISPHIVIHLIAAVYASQELQHGIKSVEEAAKEPIMQDREPDENYVKNLRFDPMFNRRVDELLGG